MKHSFLNVLACPQCGGDLRLKGAVGSEEIQTGELVCAEGHDFPIADGIPRFVGSELYAGSFGYEWTIHRTTQLDDARSHESEQAFRVKTGLTPDDLRGRLVLDVGCGMGRFSDVATRWGATVVGVDLSRAVDSAAANLGSRPQFHVAQSDVFHLPFRPETFDVIFSLGVLHHTPSTRAAFDRLPSLLKTGGTIAIWVYSADWFWTFADVYRRVTTRLPKRLLYAMSHLAVPLYHLYRLPAIRRLQPLLPVSMHPKASWRVLDTFDWYSPTYQWKHTYDEVVPWLEAHGLEAIERLEFPVSVRGTRSR